MPEPVSYRTIAADTGVSAGEVNTSRGHSGVDPDNNLPPVGDVVDWPGVDATILVEALAPVQPLASDGLIIISDQYGDPHLCERVGECWTIVRPDMLAPGQRDRYAQLLRDEWSG